jgi:hypothetical protein
VGGAFGESDQMNPDDDRKLRELPAWRNVVVAASTQEQDDLAVRIVRIRDVMQDGFDIRVQGNRENADAFRGEAIRTLRYMFSLGLKPRYTEQVQALIEQISADPDAVTVPGGMATVGWPALAGTRGGAADRDGANRGWAVRMIGFMLPASTPSRYKTIAELAAFVGTPCSQQLARSILKKGRT